MKIFVQPAPTTLSGPESLSQPHPITSNPFLRIHTMGHHPSNNTANSWIDLPSSTNLHPHHYPATLNSSRHRTDTNLQSLEHHLNSALIILIQTSGILADDVTPQARNTLKAINALISMETVTKTPTYDPLPPSRFKSVRKIAKWMQIPRSPK